MTRLVFTYGPLELHLRLSAAVPGEPRISICTPGLWVQDGERAREMAQALATYVGTEAEGFMPEDVLGSIAPLAFRWVQEALDDGRVHLATVAPPPPAYTEFICTCQVAAT